MERDELLERMHRGETIHGGSDLHAAMHEISHTLGVGQTSEFNRRCAAGDWPLANAQLRQYDGAGASLSCGGGHFWPYGLNYDNEWSETNAIRHVRIVDAMLRDGM